MNLNENWYPDEDMRVLRGAAEAARDVVGTLLELGSWEGRSAGVLAAVFGGRPLICVDLWPEDYMGCGRPVWPTFQENTRGIPSIIPVRQDILEYCRGLKDPLAFVHVDADHSYEHVRDSLLLLKPLCSPGAVLCGHDIRTGDVDKAVQEVLPGAGRDSNVWWWKA